MDQNPKLVATLSDNGIVRVPKTILFYKIQPSQPPAIKKTPSFVTNQDHDYVLKQRPTVSEFDCLIQTVRMNVNYQDIWKYYKCKLCSYKTRSYFVMRSHGKRHKIIKSAKVFKCWSSAPEKYKCVACNYRNPLLINYNKHIETTHRNSVKIKAEKGTEPIVFENFNWISATKTYHCQHCSFKTSSQLLYVGHHEKCPVYNFLKNNEKNKKYEIEIVEKYNVEEKKQHKCAICPFVSEEKIMLSKHMKQAHDRKNGFYHCKYCSYKNKYRNVLARHARLHVNPEDKRWLYCQFCPFKSLWAGSVSNHLRNVHSIKSKKQQKETQSGEMPQVVAERPRPKKKRPYQCPKCDFKSRTNIGYINHLSFRHAKDKDLGWIYCSQCHYKTIFPQHLDGHTRLRHKTVPKQHIVEASAPETWFTCDRNDFKTKDHNSLREHILTKHVSREVVESYKCDLCTYRSFVKEELTAHVLEKHVYPQITNWIHCDMCPDKFKNNADLKKHVLDNHIL